MNPGQPKVRSSGKKWGINSTLFNLRSYNYVEVVIVIDFYFIFIYALNRPFVPMGSSHFILLADDDEDDRFLFQEALNEITLSTRLTTVRDGEQLMEALTAIDLPEVLFLDLNMPRKNGFQCLSEIRKSEKLRKLPVVIFSTSFQPDAVDKLYEGGAHYYIRKPSNFDHFKSVIMRAITLVTRRDLSNMKPSKDQFVLEPDDYEEEN